MNRQHKLSLSLSLALSVFLWLSVKSQSNDRTKAYSLFGVKKNRQHTNTHSFTTAEQLGSVTDVSLNVVSKFSALSE